MLRAIEQSFWTPEQRAAYARALQVQLSKAGRLTDEGVRDLRRLLEDARRDTLARLAFATAKAEAGGSTFDLARVGSTLQEIEALLRELEEGAGRISRTAIEEAADVGRSLVDAPLRVILGTEALPAHALPRSTVAAAADFQADLITRLGRDAVRRISAEIQLGVVGVKDAREVMEAIGRNLDDPSIFGSIAARAEVIARTEMGRIQSMAGQLRMEEAEQVVRGMRKQWAWSGKSRVTHAAAHGQIRDVHDRYAIRRASTGEIERLMFPRDPAASAENSIACGCDSLPYINGLSEDLPSVEALAA